jgi:tRNA dimethylallyltransferase
VGPTASGKSALALRLAERFPIEIVSCDSLQAYRGLDIGSAKPTPEERARVPHHLIDVVSPDEPFSAAEYARLARAAVAEIASRGRVPAVVGGSGLYFRALFRGLFEGPARDPALRNRLERIARRFGDARLHRLLARVDPAAASRIRVRDRVRVIRALEVYWTTGRPISDHHRSEADPLRGYACLLAGLNPERAELREKVEQRTRRMLAGGLLEETRQLLKRYPPDTRPLRAIGYRQAQDILRGDDDAAAGAQRIVTETMRYAKRQMTWFRREPLVWFSDAEAAFAAIRDWLLARRA